jgi:tetratricopeptide (TPR) repeat protein
MMRALRLLVSIAIVVTAGWSVYRLYRRFVCNNIAMKSERAVIRLFHINDQVAARIVAREAVREVSACIPCAPNDIAQRMTLAAALRMLGRPAEAALEYRAALRVDRRSELFLNLGQAELEAGRFDAAADALTTAALTHYSFMDDYPEPMRSRVHAAVEPIYYLLNTHRATSADTKALFERVSREPM